MDARLNCSRSLESSSWRTPPPACPQLVDLSSDPTLPALLKPAESLPVGGDVPLPVQYQILGELRVAAVQTSLGAGTARGAVVVTLAVGGIGALAQKLLTAFPAYQQTRQQIGVGWQPLQ